MLALLATLASLACPAGWAASPATDADATTIAPETQPVSTATDADATTIAPESQRSRCFLVTPEHSIVSCTLR